MTIVAVLTDPPRKGLVLPELSETSSLSSAAAADLYGAMLADTALAVERSGGDLLVNYRPEDLVSEPHRGGDAEAEVRSVVTAALDESPRMEVQVGSTFAARVGNTVTHLLENEEAASVAVVEPTVPLLSRTDIDSAAMKLRSNPVVLGPATDGRVYYAGFAEPIDFAEAYRPPEIETLTQRGRDADLDVDFLSVLPTVETGGDLATVVSLIRARVAAERIVPPHTAAWIDEQGLYVEDGSLIVE